MPKGWYKYSIVKLSGNLIMLSCKTYECFDTEQNIPELYIKFITLLNDFIPIPDKKKFKLTALYLEESSFLVT